MIATSRLASNMQDLTTATNPFIVRAPPGRSSVGEGGSEECISVSWYTRSSGAPLTTLVGLVRPSSVAGASTIIPSSPAIGCDENIRPAPHSAWR